MDLNDITVSDFKTHFSRDFLYLPVWSDETTYNSDQVVYYTPNGLFYKALANGITSVPPSTPLEWELQADSVNNYVLDSDITKAFGEARVNFNQSLFGRDENITLAYLYLTAHYLIMDLQNALSGVESKGGFIVNSRSVGSVSEGYAIPEKYTKSPVYSYYAQTGYGLKYLSFLTNRAIGNVVSVAGATRP